MLNQTNWIDIVVVILLIRTGYVGFTRGLTKYSFSFLGIIAAVFFSIHYYRQIAEFLTAKAGFLTYRPAIMLSFIILVITAILFFKLIVFLMARILKLEFASFLEKAGGLIVGLVYGILLASLLLIIFSFSEAGYVEGSLANSFSAPYVMQTAPRTYDFILKILPLEASEGRADIQVSDL